LDKEQILSNVKLLSGYIDGSKDTLLSLLIDKAEKDIKVFCNNDFMVEGEYQFPEPLESVLEDLVLFRFNRLYSEGYSSETLGSRSVTFTDGLPKEIKMRLYPYRLMRVF